MQELKQASWPGEETRWGWDPKKMRFEKVLG